VVGETPGRGPSVPPNEKTSLNLAEVPQPQPNLLYLKIQEKYWYETACLLEERRKFLTAKDLFLKTLIRPFVTGTPIHTSSDQRFDQEKGDSSKPVSLTLIVILFLLSGISVTSGAVWLLPLNVLGW